MAELTVADPIYRLLHEPNLGDVAAREIISALSTYLAERTRAQLKACPGNKVLLLPILRGGLLMYPAFARLFKSSAVGLVQVVRDREHRKLVYKCLPKGVKPEVTLYLDPVASTGRTLVRASRLVRERCGHSKHLACVIAATRAAKACLGEFDIDLEGISTDETDLNGLVVPDLGERDAGDLAYLPVADSQSPTGFPIVAFERFHMDDEQAMALRSNLIYEPVLELVRSRRFRNILDLGCGAGWLTKAMSEYARLVVGYDCSGEAIKFAERENSAKNVVFTTQNPKEIHQEYDLVVCCMVLNSTHAVDDIVKLAANCCTSDSIQAWTILHPSFQFNESQWRARKCVSPTDLSVSFSLMPSYFDEHTFEKQLGDIPLTEHHRPISSYAKIFTRSGFFLEDIVEPRAGEESTTVVDYLAPRTIMFITSGPLTRSNCKNQSDTVLNKEEEKSE